MKTFLRYSIVAIVLFAAFAWLNNTSLLSLPSTGTPVLLAHRGLAQITREALERDTCTATRIHKPLLGWAGYVPDDCRAGLMLVPLNVAPWLWGWPVKFMQRMDAAGVDVFVLGPYDGSFGTSGIDDLEQFALLPKGFTGGIWTNRIDRIGAAARGNAMAP